MSELVEREHLRRYANQLEQKLGWGPVADWGQRDFVQLSDLIFQTAKINVSVTTLKRILGRVEYKGLPYTATLNALAQVLGYSDWLAFKMGKSEQSIEPSPLADLINPRALRPEEPSTPWYQNQLAWRGAGIGLFFGLLVGSLMFLLRPIEYPTPEVYTGPNILEVSPTVSDGKLPAKFYYKYVIPKAYKRNLNVINIDGVPDRPIRFLQEDSIGQGNGEFRINKAGLYIAKIFSNKTMLGYQHFVIPTQGWVTRFNQLGQQTTGKSFRSNGMMNVHLPDLVEHGIDTTADFLMEYVRVTDFGFDGDDMVLECRLKCHSNSYNHNRPKFGIKVRGSGLPIHLTFDASSTSHDIYNQYADVVVPVTDQKKYFVKPLNDFSYIKLIIKDKKATILLDDKQVYSLTYTKPIGRVFELSSIFRGLGEMDMIRISNNAGQALFEDDF